MERWISKPALQIEWLFFLMICLPPSVWSQRFTLDNAIQTLVSDSVMQAGQAGICVMDVQTGEILGSHNASMSLIPASNMKVVTTAAALKILGGDYSFRTELQYDGYIQDSILKGNIIIKGYGDPTLGSSKIENSADMQSFLDAVALKVKSLGVKRVEGKIIGDGSSFENATALPTWAWADLGNYYGAGASGLNLNENMYELNFSQNSDVGSPPSVVGFTPHIPDFFMYNEVNSTAGGGDNSYIYTAPYAQVGIVRGTIPSGTGIFKVSGSIPDPPYFAAWHLRRTFLEKGINVVDSATTQIFLQHKGYDFQPRRNFFSWRSPRLSTIIERTNLESVNLYCESLVKVLGLEAGKGGTHASGIDVIKDFWKLQGINTNGMFMQDGSGLSSRNGLTPLQLTSMLRLIAIDKQWFIPFYQSLPEAGLTGTMKGMFKNYPIAIGKIRAKTGSISRVRSFSGYVTTLDGRILAFSVILNNFTCSQTEIRKRLEPFMADLVKL